MATNIFKDPTSRVPTKDSRIQRVEFSESEIGARSSHLPKGSVIKNDQNIEHVKAGT